MSEGSLVSWTDDTRNSIVGCDMDGPECAQCYAIEVAARLVRMNEERRATSEAFARVYEKYSGLVHLVQRAHGDFLDWTGVVKFDPAVLEEVRQLPIPRDGRPRKQFWCSMGDVFHDKAVAMPGVLDQHLDVWLGVDHAIHMVLTKRTWNMGKFFRARGYHDGNPLPPHIWPGCTIGTNKRAQEHMEAIALVPAECRWLSIEPQLEMLDLRPWLLRSRWDRDSHGRWKLVPAGHASSMSRPYVDWIVVGGESDACGREARDWNPEWAVDLFWVADQAGCRVHMKQVGTKQARRWKLKARDGEKPDEWPLPWLQRREFPTPARSALPATSCAPA